MSRLPELLQLNGEGLEAERKTQKADVKRQRANGTLNVIPTQQRHSEPQPVILNPIWVLNLFQDLKGYGLRICFSYAREKHPLCDKSNQR